MKLDLTSALIEQIARRAGEVAAEQAATKVVDELVARGLVRQDRFVTADELAAHLGISRSAVYERRAEFGGVALWEGEKAPIRFDLDRVLKQLRGRTESPPSTAPAAPARRRRASEPRPPSLPIRAEHA